MSLRVYKITLLSWLLLFPISGRCDLTGNWTITRIIKTTEQQTNAKGARPSQSINIVQTSYNFNADGTLTTAGGNQGTWKESKGRFNIYFDKAIQAENLAQTLKDQGFKVNALKVLKDTNKGTIYPNGIIGNSTGIFTVDITTEQERRYQAKVTVTFSFAGLTPATTTVLPTMRESAAHSKPVPFDETGIVDFLRQRISATGSPDIQEFQ